MSQNHDALIVGGSTVGAAAALALAALGRRVALVDRRALPDPDAEREALDPRVVAVSPGSRALLQALGAWEHVRTERIAAYHEMQVEAGRGHIDFDAGEHNLPALGWIVELAELDRALARARGRASRITPLAPAEIKSVRIKPDGAEIELEDGRRVTGRMLLGADGARSRVREAAGISTVTHHYNQRALVTHLHTERWNPGIAWQRFGEPGTLALLPLPEGRSSLVWSINDHDAERLLAMDDAGFLEALNRHVEGSPFGRIETAEARHGLPLIRRQSRNLAAGPVALLGDAARSVHPLAGQGLNLGLGDVAALIEALTESDAAASRRDFDPGPALTRYARRRGSDSILVAGGIHAFNELGTLGAPVRLAMGLGFNLLRQTRTARDLFVRRACGLDEVKAAVERLAE